MRHVEITISDSDFFDVVNLNGSFIEALEFSRRMMYNI